MDLMHTHGSGLAGQLLCGGEAIDHLLAVDWRRGRREGGRGRGRVAQVALL